MDNFAAMLKTLDIVYEDKWFVAIDKPSGLLSVGAPGRREITAYDLVSEYLCGKYNGRTRAFVLHRIDQYTSGILLFAKDRKVQEYMRDNWNDVVRERLYTAVLAGIPEPREGVVVSYLSADRKNFTVFSSLSDNGGLRAVSNYKVTATGENSAGENPSRCRSLVEFRIESGRKNQIRVQAASHLGCPVLGDRKYGNAAANKDVKRLCLHHKGLSFEHPVTGRIIRISCNAPRYFKGLIFQASQSHFTE